MEEFRFIALIIAALAILFIGFYAAIEPKEEQNA